MFPLPNRQVWPPLCPNIRIDNLARRGYEVHETKSLRKKGKSLMPTAVFQITLPAKIKKKRDRFISSCAVLDIHSQGYTEEEAKKNLVQAIKLFFISCYERGILDETLKECGFQASRAPAKPVRETGFVTVPIPFTTRSHCVRECRV